MPDHVLDLSDAVTLATEMCKLWAKTELERKKIDISFELNLKPGCTVSGVPDQLTWVVLNILKNSVEDIRIALGGVAPTPVRAGKTEQAFKGQTLDWQRITELSKSVREEISPITDVRGSAEYRKKVSAGLLAKAIRQALGMEE